MTQNTTRPVRVQPGLRTGAAQPLAIHPKRLILLAFIDGDCLRSRIYS